MRLTAWTAKAALSLGLLSTPAFANIEEALATANPENGERVFKKCAACHTTEKDGKNRVGPNLYGIVGAEVAAIEGFKYSSALMEFGGEWTAERLDAFLAAPRQAVKGTKMSFAGLKDLEDRADVIAYLNTMSDEPMDFGGAGATEASMEQEPEEPEYGVLKVAEGVDVTYYTCTACHSEMIIAQQGLSREHWDDMLVWMVEEQGMSEIDEPDRSQILDYLAAHYNEDRPNFPDPNAQ